MDTSNVRTNALKDTADGQGEPGLAIAAIALSCVTAVALLHPHPLVLPLLSVILVMASLGLSAFVAFQHRHESGSLIDRLHLAGLIMFFGFAAAMMGDPDPAVKSLEALRVGGR